MTVKFRRDQPQLTAEDLEIVNRIKMMAEEMHESIDMAPVSPARETAKGKLQACVMWAVKAIWEHRYERAVHSNRGMSLNKAVFEFAQAAAFDRLKMVLNRIARALFMRPAASLSVISWAWASSCLKVMPGLRNCLALGRDLSFS